MLKSIENAELTGKTVLCRVDYNVPIDNGKILDDTKIIKSLPTMNFLLERASHVIICSHLGRPKGQYNQKLSLKPISIYLSNTMNCKVAFVEGLISNETKYEINKLKRNYRIILLDNLRFNPGEKSNDRGFSEKLAELADVFVLDAFGVVHRAHASTKGITTLLKSHAGFLVRDEYERLMEVIENPKVPSIAMFGGIKISTKLKVVQNFVGKVDLIVLGGGMANTFLAAKGISVGKSLIETEMIPIAKNILQNNETRIILPIDVRIATEDRHPIMENSKAKIVNVDEIKHDEVVLDIGPKTVELIISELEIANTIIWNGPLGVFENKYYRKGTLKIARKILKMQKQTVIGGGETIYALSLINHKEISPNIHISTGGGATLELLSGKKLPGIESLKRAPLID